MKSPLFVGSGVVATLRLLRALSAVLGAGLLTVVHRSGVVGATDDVITNTGEVANTAAADEDDGVLLEVVALTRNVCGDLDAVNKTDTGNLTKSRVRLLGGGGEHAGAHAALLGVVLQSCVLGLLGNGLTTLANQLVDSRQNVLLLRDDSSFILSATA
jgi:hypothetical protein